MKRVTVLGGYGVFGGRIASALGTRAGVIVRVVGRDGRAARRFAKARRMEHCEARIENGASLRNAIAGSSIVIHAAGPFQGRDYRVAETCIEEGAHYLDLADARDFVAGIGALNERARRRGVFVSSGVSSVPGVTSAIVSFLRPSFRAIEEIQMALSPGNQNPRGASTIGAILTYLGRPIRLWQDGEWIERPGWEDSLELLFPPPVGRRRVYNCDVPDLELFPELFGARTVRFRAGVELAVFNRCLSWLSRQRQRGRFEHLPRRAALFRRLSLLLYPLGSKNGALAVWVRGTAHDGTPIERSGAIVTDDDGPATPCSPAIVLAGKLLDQGAPRVGAFPCVGFLALEELANHLRSYGVWYAHGGPTGWAPVPQASSSGPTSK